jgi:hypothetical protein
MLIVSQFFIKFFTPKNIKGISLFPFIIVENKQIKLDKYFINHEKIHIKQQLEMMLVLFYLWYGIEFVIKLFKYKKFYLAYENISFEKEAYLNEKNLEYLKNRKFWGFIKYL